MGKRRVGGMNERKGYWQASGFCKGKNPKNSCVHKHKSEAAAIECCKKLSGDGLYWIATFHPACPCGSTVGVVTVDAFACKVLCKKCRAKKRGAMPAYISAGMPTFPASCECMNDHQGETRRIAAEQRRKQ